MKKLIVLVTLFAVLLSGCAAQGVTQVKPENVIEKFDASESFVVYLGLSYCSACKIFKSIIESVIKSDGIEVFYVEYDTEMDGNEESLKALVENHLQQNEVFPYSFPIIFVVSEGKIIDQFSLQQTDTEQEFIDRMVKNGVISQ